MSRGSGPDRERQVREFLERVGYVVARSAGSRGCFDLMALRGEPRSCVPGGTRLLVQVKSDRANPYAHFGPAERAKLTNDAARADADEWLCWWPPDRKGMRWIPPWEWPSR